MRLLLDTCAIIWAISQPEKLTAQVISSLEMEDSKVFFSVISSAEIACAVSRGRLKIKGHWKTWFNHYTTLNGWTPIEIDLAVIQEAYSLPEGFHADPADRIITASARLFNCSVITADMKILDYPHVQSIW
jgi:PIN domain nuclease of toxin-antitoxin system